jgi:hypothetical protein
MWCLWEEGIKLSDIHLWESAVCGEKAPVHVVFNWIWSFNIGKKTAKLAICKWYHNTTK